MRQLLYDINSWWPGKTEAPEVVGAKFLQTLDSLERLAVSFKDWESSDEIDGSRAHQSEPLRGRIGAWIATHPPPTVDLAEWVPGTGYWVYAVSGGESGASRSRQAAFHVQAGSHDRH